MTFDTTRIRTRELIRMNFFTGFILLRRATTTYKNEYEPINIFLLIIHEAM